MRVLDVLGRPTRLWLGLGAAVALSGWLLGLTVLSVLGGQPHDDGTGPCQYYLNNHGDRTCITRGEYDVALAQLQSMGFAAGAFFLGFGTIATSGRQDP